MLAGRWSYLPTCGSPNGKRYARKGRGGEIEEAFGFSLARCWPGLQFKAAAERVHADNKALRLMRERITLDRLTSKLIEAALDEDVLGNWEAYGSVSAALWRQFRGEPALPSSN
ncbi:helix-turn-helix domain-containing protein [Mesorhizobium sp. M7A.F.Ca.US.008.03.1.1]|uniref:helix-turn-helix domain-containing protein n=1 Tax=Mesorhizobium sp. M7A.F.Ca.US.008.03.1.1 TaxID=2496742 RepID=UPI001FDF6C48|nr:helix-turn-helix domain-containing protein [Mesorhizobium sp. M7A.F.Ca.US.008.03.1.1]